ncbi:MAG: succinate dehydrogenase, cytochrome b556 subunit [Paracoccaceae bacterium]
MPEVNRGDRPLSPHLQIYKPQLHSAMSIFFRITGCALAVSGALLVWWLIAAATGPEAFGVANGVLTSIPGLLVMLLSLAGLAYHLLGGIRHLAWDFGYGFRIDTAQTTGMAVLIGTAVLTVLVLVIA